MFQAYFDLYSARLFDFFLFLTLDELEIFPSEEYPVDVESRLSR